MTIQNTHHEHDDANSSVVEPQHVSEDMAAPSIPETPTPDEGTHIQAGISASDEPATPAEPHAETSPETPVVSEAPVPSVAEQHVTPELAPQNSYNPEATTIHTVYAEQSPLAVTEETTGASSNDKVPLTTVEGDEGHTRPFIDFIEEFRLAEEARLSASRQEIPTESFELLTSSPFVAEASPASEEALFSQTSSDGASAVTPSNEEVHSAEDVSSPATFATPSLEKADIASSIQQSLTEESTQEPPLSPAPPERAVSPLLRPATRLRIPRHGARHIREESVTEKPVATPSASIAPAPLSGQVSPAEAVTEPEQPQPPRPARRYRFDRPASTANGSASAAPVQPAAVPQRAEESRENIPNRGSQIVQNGNESQNDNASVATKSATSNENTPAATPSVEQPAQKQAQEAPVTESTSTSHVIEHGRRHSVQERQKEQTAAAPTTTPVAAATDAAVPSGAVAPEDLPPLEYSELQKASTRRRRRHRTSATNGSAPVLATPEQVAQPPALPVPAVPAVPGALIVPIAPAASVAPVAPPSLAEAISSQYSIVSGYTVSQMNMGSEVGSGPFMGPEPSPARGSLVTREGRTTRAESQRTPIYTPGRTHEAAPSSASLNHFASVISQAIQTQTDRMVAELRRDSQSPTNVSVSLPPFPSTERVGVFVDVANLLYSARTLRMAVDFGKLLDFLRGNRRLVRAHAYCPTSPQAGDEQMFLQAVKGLGYRITTKNYKTFSSGAKKADLDLDLCMDVVRLVDGRAVDCVVLVSGDSDFMPMLDYCSDHGVRVEVAAFDEAMSATLRQSCDLFINLSMLEEIRA